MVRVTQATRRSSNVSKNCMKLTSLGTPDTERGWWCLEPAGQEQNRKAEVSAGVPSREKTQETIS